MSLCTSFVEFTVSVCCNSNSILNHITLRSLCYDLEARLVVESMPEQNLILPAVSVCLELNRATACRNRRLMEASRRLPAGAIPRVVKVEDPRTT